MYSNPPTQCTKKAEKLLSAGYNFNQTVGDCEKAPEASPKTTFKHFRKQNKTILLSVWQLNLEFD